MNIRPEILPALCLIQSSAIILFTCIHILPVYNKYLIPENAPYPGPVQINFQCPCFCSWIRNVSYTRISTVFSFMELWETDYAWWGRSLIHRVVVLRLSGSYLRRDCKEEWCVYVWVLLGTKVRNLSEAMCRAEKTLKTQAGDVGRYDNIV